MTSKYEGEPRSDFTDMNDLHAVYAFQDAQRTFKRATAWAEKQKDAAAAKVVELCFNDYCVALHALHALNIDPDAAEKADVAELEGPILAAAQAAREAKMQEQELNG